MRYEIQGGSLPVVICEVENGETLITERGSMSWMSPNMRMETSSGGGFGRALGRMFAGDSLFLNRYTAQGGRGTIAFASSFPGSIRAFEIGPGVKNMLFGGEGIFNTVITGPGRIWLQSMPIHAVAGAIRPYIPTGNDK